MSKREYNQICALAKGLDVLGGRWTLLIVRNLILGPMRYGELMDTLPGITTNYLADRLKTMTDLDIIKKSGREYELTDKGRDLEPVVRALGNWGERYALELTEDDVFNVRYLMTSVWRKIQPTDHEFTACIRIAGRPFTIEGGPNPNVFEGEVNHYDVELLFETPIDAAKVLAQKQDHTKHGSIIAQNEQATFALRQALALAPSL